MNHTMSLMVCLSRSCLVASAEESMFLNDTRDGVGLQACEAALLQLLDGCVRIESQCRHRLVRLAFVRRGQGRDRALGNVAREAPLLQLVAQRF